MQLPAFTPQPKPKWLKVKVPGGPNYNRIKEMLHGRRLHTVCEEAHCPNIGECWDGGTATFMIMGDTCTRGCRFCAVKTAKVGTPLDPDEPQKVSESIAMMGLDYVVITSVNRDELPDGGASVFAEAIRRVRLLNPGVQVEVLIPDFRGVGWALDLVVAARPDVLNHNIETVPRLYNIVRAQAKYQRSVDLLRRAKVGGMLVKSGMMLGIGESVKEILAVMRDLRGAGCDILTLGQYLQPTKEHLPVDRYVHPDEFRMLKTEGLAMGFKHVESGPLVRSSYHAERQV